MAIALGQHHRLAQKIRRIYQDSPWLARTKQSLRPYICPFDLIRSAVPPGAHVLDAGCGSGLLLAMLALADLHVTGVGFDTDRNSIRYAQMMAHRMEGVDATLRFECLDATAAWPQDNFDVVCMIDLLHHVPVHAQQDVFGRAIEAVRPGGLIVYKGMCRRPRWRAAANQLHDLVLARQWIRHVSADDVERWAAKRGLHLAARAFEPRLWYGHELRVFRRPTHGDGNNGDVTADPRPAHRHAGVETDSAEIDGFLQAA